MSHLCRFLSTHSVWAYMLWSAHRNPTRHIEPQVRLKELYKVPQRSSDRPICTNQITRKYAPAWGVSMRLLSYLFDELRGEYEKFPIQPHSESPVVRMYARSPLRKGSRAETRTLARTTYQPPSDAHPQPVRGLRGRTYSRYAWVSFNTTMY